MITLPEIWDKKCIDVDYSQQIVESNKDIIKGIKIRAIQAVTESVGLKAIEMAKKLATDLGSLKGANMVVLGAYLEKSGLIHTDTVNLALKGMLKKASLLDLNQKAVDTGRDFVRKSA